MDYNHEDWISEFNLKNISLATLASEAAIDIFNYTSENILGGKSVNCLSKLLNDITQGEKPRVLLPDNGVVLGYAISGREKFKEYWKDKGGTEVLLQINLAAKDLRDFKNLSTERRKNLVNFCVDLSREVVDHYSIYYS